LSSGGGGGIVIGDLTSTSQGLGTLGYVSSTERLVNVSTQGLQASTLTMANSVLSMSSNVTTGQNNLFVNSLTVGSYNPLRLVVSTLGNDGFLPDPVYLLPEDIGKYFLLTTDATGDANVYFPTLPDTNLAGWNVKIKNATTSPNNLRLQTSGSANVGPGSNATVLMDDSGTNSYSF
jgi:hypothetical protein